MRMLNENTWNFKYLGLETLCPVTCYTKLTLYVTLLKTFNMQHIILSVCLCVENSTNNFTIKIDSIDSFPKKSRYKKCRLLVWSLSKGDGHLPCVSIEGPGQALQRRT